MSNWTPDLSASHGPIYRAIAVDLAAAVAAGTLPPGARLPTQRDLAAQLGVSVQTVSQAYAEAERQGLVIGRVGRGTFVAKTTAHPEPRFIMDRRNEDVIDLSINRPVYGQRHAERLRAELASFGQDDRGIEAMLLCRPIAGLAGHREAAAHWLERRGLKIAPNQVLITNGGAHGLLVALAGVAKAGDLVLTEALVDHGIISIASLLGVTLRGLPVDAEGILPDALEAACGREPVTALCTTPTLNNPTAALMSAARRRAIAAIARRHGVWVIEDDVYGDLVEGGPLALATHLPERTCYVTSFTKTVVSGLRTGYLVAPPALVPRLVRRIRTTSWMATPLVSALASRWVETGTAAELVAWQREALGERQRVLWQALGGFALHQQPTALHAWLELPPPWRPEAFVAEARVQNVAITPAQPFMPDDTTPPPGIRISVGAARSVGELRAGLAVLADLLERRPEPFYMPT